MRNFEKQFMNYDSRFRIEAVIHDGQWYTASKLAVQSKTSEEEVNEYLKENEDYLTRLDDSYRVKADKIIAWYKKNNLDIKDRLVPDNFPPKIWGGLTEADNLIQSPKEIMSRLTIESDDEKSLEYLRGFCSFYGKVESYHRRSMDSDTMAIIVWCPNAIYLRERILQEIPQNIVKRITLSTRAPFYRRDINFCSKEFLDNFTVFYLNYGISELRNSVDIMNVYMESTEDFKSQILDWAFEALSKFDETKPIPFAGYFSRILKFRPRDLPSAHLGRHLGKFTKDFSRAREYVELTEGIKDPSFELIVDELSKEYTKEEVLELYKAQQNWVGIKNAEDLVGESEYEKANGGPIEKPFVSEDSPELGHALSLSILEAALETESFGDGIFLIGEIGKTNMDLERIRQVNQEMKESLWGKLERGEDDSQ